ncbi:hypothetical protein [Bacillus wiedmannii]|uniref:hypothetical protein n=1 Tax=Bacillus wiedmannii TaxID=1890302 RepID=UPI002E1A5352|nr:hypothetical protein [Bacillus wiedmannii]
MTVHDINDLNDPQQENLMCLLKESSGAHLEKIKIKFSIANKKKKAYIHEDIWNSLVTGLIPLSSFMSWLCSSNLEGNNSIFVYEPEDTKVFKTNSLEKLYKKLQSGLTPLYNINKDTLKTIELVDLQMIKETKQLLITFAAPSQLQIKDKDNSTTHLENEIYFAYFIVDYTYEHIVLLMHPTANLISIGGETKKEWDDLTWILLKAFRDKIFPFETLNPEWIVTTLFEITEEFFNHNNPQIDNKMEEIKQNLIPDLLKKIKKADTSFEDEEYAFRFERSLENIFENELINSYGTISKKFPFNVFLQESDRGITQFKTNARGQALNYAEAGEFVKLMWNRGDIVSLGITYIEKDENTLEKKHSYKVYKTSDYYSFKKTNTTGTKKEVIDYVLRVFDEYKQKVQSSLPDAGDIEQRTYDAENE